MVIRIYIYKLPKDRPSGCYVLCYCYATLFQEMDVGDVVIFEVEFNDKGMPQARCVRKCVSSFIIVISLTIVIIIIIVAIMIMMMLIIIVIIVIIIIIIVSIIIISIITTNASS